MGSIYKYPLRRLSKRRLLFVILSLLYIVSSFALKQWASGEIQPGIHVFPSRKLLSVNDTEKNESRCTEPSIREFPTDIFSQMQRRHGAVLLHIFMAVYMFVALAFVCDDYFISALDKICERLNLSEDVAGATFMAAGSSAPELFTSIIGVFIAKGDVGVGTIVGSAVFNILIIISFCGLFAGQVIRLTWWPLFRDSLYYTVAIAALIWSIYDGYVTWYESLVMLLLYVGYIILMKFNPLIVDRINARAARKHAVRARERADSDTNLVSRNEPSVKYTVNAHTDYDDLELIEGRRKLTWKELGMMIMLTDKFSPTTRFRAACLIVILRGEHKQDGGESNEREDDDHQGGSLPNESQESNDGDSSTEMEGQPFLYPQGSIVRIVFWAMSLPLVTVLYFTIPDCRKPRWAAWYIATFICSIFWIMVFSYLMVWMVCIIGYTLGIPDVIMGITFLAAGTSIPDAISSLLVAREGLGDMAVSNSIGSNIFDILIGLAIPWFIKSAIIGDKVRINSRGMVYSVGLLFASVVLTVLVIYFNKWRLNKKLGGLFIIFYLIFVTFSALIEFNVFGFVNYPTCPYVA